MYHIPISGVYAGALAAVKSMLEGTSDSSSGSSTTGQQQQQQLSGATPTERELEWGKAGPTLLHACVTIASWITSAAAASSSATAAAASTAADAAAAAATEDSSSGSASSSSSAEDEAARAQGRLLIAQLLLDWVGPGGTPDIACLDDSGLTVRP
jgi:peptidoglycan DL-endopeptidase CwlO